MALINPGIVYALQKYSKSVDGKMYLQFQISLWISVIIYKISESEEPFELDWSVAETVRGMQARGTNRELWGSSL